MPLKKPAPVAHGWVARRPRSLTLAPARRRLRGNGLGFKAKWLLRAARLKARPPAVVSARVDPGAEEADPCTEEAEAGSKGGEVWEGASPIILIA